MVKLTYSSDISDSVGVGGEIVKSASELKKQASTIFNKEYDELKPPEGKTGIHLVALGAMETYGFNRNADGFKQADCRDRCDTFVKHGHVYQHHRNKDPEKALGEIKCAAYNPDMDRVELYIWADNEKAKDHLERLEKTGEVSFSMACQVPSDTCFTKGTLILTTDGFRPIDTVTVGDNVVTVEGVVKPVTAAMVREACALTRVSIRGVPDELECTPSHPFNTVSCEKMRSCHGTAGGKKRRHTPQQATTKCACCGRQIDTSSEWRRADELVAGDYIKEKIDSSSDTVVRGTAFAYLCGMYVGDGFVMWQTAGHGKTGDTTKPAGIGISASGDERDAVIIDKIKQAFLACTGKEASVVRDSRGKNAYYVHMYDTLLASRVMSLTGMYSRGKRIDQEILQWSLEEKAAFIAGYFDADGHIGTRNNHPIMRICSVNKGLLLSVQRLLWSLGMPATVGVGDTCPSRYTTADYSQASAVCYHTFFSRACDKLVKYSAKLTRDYKSELVGNGGSGIVLMDGYAYLPVASSRTFLCDPVSVYNVEVADEHTYIAEGVGVHNCSLCGATRKGPGDENECEHIKYQLGKIAEDGKFIGMINNEPKWFDISFVGRPADRIAWSLKTASGLCDSVKQAEYEGVVLPDELAVTSDKGLRKLALMKELAGASSKMKGWLKKASFESTEERRMFEMRKLAALSMPDGLLNDLRAYGPRDTFEALADAGVVMDVPSFFKYAMGPDYKTVKPYIGEVEKAASAVLEKAVADGSCSAFCNSTEFDAFDSSDLRRKPLPMALQTKLAEYGCDNPASKIMDITLTGKTPTFSVDGGQENSVISVVSTKLAEKYLTYKLAAVDAVLNSRYGANRNKNNLAAISAAQDLKLGENDDK